MGSKDIVMTAEQKDVRRNKKQIMLFIVFAILIAWPPMIIISKAYLNPQSFTFVMFAPFLATLLADKFSHDKGTGINWKFNIRKNIKLYAFAWFAPIIFSFLGACIYYLIFPQRFSLQGMQILASAHKQTLVQYILIQVLVTSTITVFMSAVPAMGEEAGWRGYLAPRLYKRFGLVPSLLLTSVVWGAWQWPMLYLQYESIPKLINTPTGLRVGFSGYLYGCDYVAGPWLGMVCVCIYALASGIILWWLYTRCQSVWAASLFHGACDATGMFALGFRDFQSVTQWILGPSLPGILSMIPMAAFAAYLLIKRRDEMIPKD